MTVAQGNATFSLFRNRDSAQMTWLFEITRTDGVQHRFTNHDQVLSDLRLAAAFQPGVSSFAKRRSAGLEDQSTELRGLVGNLSGQITEEDLRLSRLGGATVLEIAKDWRFPFWSFGVIANRYEISNVTWDAHEWRFTLTGLASRLKRRIGDIHSRLCQNQVGVVAETAWSSGGVEDDFVLSHCSPKGLPGNGLLDPPYTLSKTVLASPAPSAYQFSVNSSGSFVGALAAADNYKYGRVIVDSGSLSGQVFPIFSSEVAGSTLTITVLVPMSQAIEVGASVRIKAGCNKTIGTCGLLYGNLGHFRGGPHIPGTDATVRSGDAS